MANRWVDTGIAAPGTATLGDTGWTLRVEMPSCNVLSYAFADAEHPDHPPRRILMESGGRIDLADIRIRITSIDPDRIAIRYATLARPADHPVRAALRRFRQALPGNSHVTPVA